jgi:hypothetical protein
MIDTIAVGGSPPECVARRRPINIEKRALEFSTLPKIHATDRKLERQRIGIVQANSGRRCITLTKKHGAAPHRVPRVAAK